MSAEVNNNAMVPHVGATDLGERGESGCGLVDHKRGGSKDIKERVKGK